MFYEKVIRSAKEKISRNKLDEAIDLLKINFTREPLLDELTMISYRLKSINKKVRLGTVSNEVENLRKNEIALALLGVCNELYNIYCDNEGKINFSSPERYQIKSNGYERELQEHYSILFHWVRSTLEKSSFNEHLDIHNHEYDKKFVSELPIPSQAQYGWMVTLPYKILHDDLNFLLELQSRTDSSIADNIRKHCSDSLEIIQKSTALCFHLNEEAENSTNEKMAGKIYGTYLRTILEKEKLLKEVFYQKEEESLGGIIACIKENLHINGGMEEFEEEEEGFFVFTPDQLGMKQVEDLNSLPLLILEDKVKLEEVYLCSESRQVKENSEPTLKEDVLYKVKGTIINKQSVTINCNFPKGLIFETKGLPPNPIRSNISQNLALKKGSTIKIPPHGYADFELPAYCIDIGFTSPNFEQGNVTIYEVEDKNFSSNYDIWIKSRKRSHDIITNLSK